jgi:hypothetical protein
MTVYTIRSGPTCVETSSNSGGFLASSAMVDLATDLSDLNRRSAPASSASEECDVASVRQRGRLAQSREPERPEDRANPVRLRLVLSPLVAPLAGRSLPLSPSDQSPPLTRARIRPITCVRAMDLCWTLIAGHFDDCGNMKALTTPELPASERRRRDADLNTAARAEMLRLDGERSLGENLEQADALIRAAFELANGFSAAGG